MTIQKRAALVLQQIDAALALAEKEVVPDFVMPTGYVGLNNKGEHYRVGWHHGAAEYAAFIASSRTLLPASLRCLKTAIEGLLPICREYETARTALTTLCDQWEAGR